MDKIILVFDIKNLQNHFSILMKIVNNIESNNSYELMGNNDIQLIGKISYCWLKENTYSNYSSLRKVREIEKQFYNNEQQGIWKLHDISDLNQVFMNKEKYEINYYIRVKIEEDVKNIQYLILLLQQFKIYHLEEKIIVFMVPFLSYYNAGIEDKGLFSSYFKYSHYMRFIVEKYKNIFYSAFFKTHNKSVEIVPLSNKKTGTQSTFFPLLEIDSEMHSLISQHCFFDYNGFIYPNNEINKNQKLIDIIEISKKILLENIKKINKKQKENYISEKQINIELEKRSITPLEYAIFSILLSNVEVTEKDYIINCILKAESIANGLLQLIENIVLHSENHMGIFTFRIVEESKNYLYSNFEDEFNTYSPKILEIDICDSNMKESIIENFLHKLSSESKYFKEIELSIAHFFNSYQNEKERQAWMQFRTEYPVRCLGLERLNLELKSCHALLKVRSNTEFNNHDERYYFESNYLNGIPFIQSKNENYIPGTQFQIVFPMFIQNTGKAGKKHNANTYLNGIGNIVENDKVYADAIDYTCEEISFEKIVKSNENELKIENNIIKIDQYIYEEAKKITENNIKDRMVEIWKKKIDEWYKKQCFIKQRIYYINLERIEGISSPWGIETLCKGIVSSRLLQNSHLSCFVFLNSSDEFIKMFFNTILLSKKYLKSNMVIYLLAKNGIDDLFIAGKTRNEIIRNAIQYAYFKGELPDYLQLYINECISGNQLVNEVSLIPYDVIITDVENKKTIFESYIEKISDKNLTNVDEAGYFIPHAHMRLGNKVHLDGFYETSILFRKPRIARKIALLILRSMKQQGINICMDILFYGYASYSRAILIALVEILKSYQEQKKIKKRFVEFAVYQNDILIQKTLSDISPKVRMYFSNPIPENKKINIVQIVPISTTFTTFNKMWDMFIQRSTNIKTTHYHLIRNYTLFWVRDLQIRDENILSSIEKEYFNKILENRIIKTNLISSYPRYFCCKRVKWQNPLNCEWCYPKNLIDEIALVETDVTSTVPSQQLEVSSHNINFKKNNENSINEKRLVDLEDCIYYGHISRDNNHFQFYIDTINYFHKQKKLIAEWLKNLQNECTEQVKKDSNKQLTSILNIIVTSQHPTNVEFSHYVNDYFFNGNADIVIIDSTKEYRSNIVAKYADVKMAIENAQKLGIQVKFTYVDDTIITGTTFRRVNTLLHSLVSIDTVNPLQIDRIFVLVNRLSWYSKKDYVKDSDKNFLAYVNIDISSIRSYGDSCTMCTLHKNAKLFSYRASTKALSEYWNTKQYIYNVIPFDKYSQVEFKKKWMKLGYFRMLCSHYVKNNLLIDENIGKTILNIVKILLDIKYFSQKSEAINTIRFDAEEIVEDYGKNESPIYKEVFCKNIELTIKSFLKILCRPFFSYGKIYRQAILDIFLLLSQCCITEDFSEKLADKTIKISKKKKYLNDYTLRKYVLEFYEYIKQEIPQEKYISFIHEYLLEGLTDLRSNYIIRRTTIINVNKLIKNDNTFKYSAYEQLIYRTINNSADETKSLWLGYLLLTGKENYMNIEENTAIKFEIFEKNKSFLVFWDSLFIDNTRLYYDGILNFVKKACELYNEKKDEEKIIDDAVNILWNDYYIRNLRKFISLEIRAEYNYDLSYSELNKKVMDRIKNSAKLLYLLKTQTTGGIDRYEKLRNNIQKLLYQGDELIILTKGYSEENMQENFCAVVDYEETHISLEIISNIKDSLKADILLEKGFYIGKDFIVLCIDNNYEKLHKKDKSIVKIQPLYFYIKCNTKNKLQVIIRIRNILMYRHQLLRWLEADFNNNAVPILTQQVIINRQLIRERAGDHSSKKDITVTQRVLQSKLIEKQLWDGNKNLDIYIWLLLRSYINLRIARLFRNEWSKFDRDMIYTKEKNYDKMNGPLFNLGNSFFGETLQGLSPKRYFEFVYDMFEFNLKTKKGNINNVDINLLENFFSELNGREENGYYYKQENIICIVFDILFNAIKNCTNWERYTLDAFSNNEKEREIFIDSDDIMVYYVVLRQNKEKCRVNISTESADDKVNYLVFTNRVDSIRCKNDVKKENQKFNALLETKDTKGMSIQTMQWYTESITFEKKVKAKFFYRWNNENNAAEFVTMLPILKKGTK